MIIRGILYIDGKWYGIEPLNTSSTSEHVFYPLEDMQDIPFRCGVLNGSLHHEKMFVKQSVKYSFLSNSTSSREKLLRVNTFLFLSWVQAFSSACSSSQGSPELLLWHGVIAGGFGLADHFCIAFVFMDPKLVAVLLRKPWNRRTAQWEFNIAWSNPLVEEQSTAQDSHGYDRKGTKLPFSSCIPVSDQIWITDIQIFIWKSKTNWLLRPC